GGPAVRRPGDPALRHHVRQNQPGNDARGCQRRHQLQQGKALNLRFALHVAFLALARRDSRSLPSPTTSNAQTTSAAILAVPLMSPPSWLVMNTSVTSIPPAIQPSSAAPNVTTIGNRSMSLSTRVLPQMMMGTLTSRPKIG